MKIQATEPIRTPLLVHIGDKYCMNLNFPFPKGYIEIQLETDQYFETIIQFKVEEGDFGLSSGIGFVIGEVNRPGVKSKLQEWIDAKEQEAERQKENAKIEAKRWATLTEEEKEQEAWDFDCKGDCE